MTEMVKEKRGSKISKCSGTSNERRYSSTCALLKEFCHRTSSHGIPLIGYGYLFIITYCEMT
ncbi:unnamed protein product [Brugia timori]|uniref:Ovule protein n=1 Tax=Brugia timori TaxID=42155 RepID=A0A0R3R7Y7_9BILA|nr:unnamed protein product [Brugia timori]